MQRLETSWQSDAHYLVLGPTVLLAAGFLYEEHMACKIHKIGEGMQNLL